MFSGALLVGFVIVLAWCVLPLVYGVELVGLLEDPTFSVGMISRFTRGTVDLTYLVQNFVEAGQFIPGAFSGRLLTWARAFESGVDCRALRAVSLSPALVLASSRFPVSIPDFGCTWVAGAASG